MSALVHNAATEGTEGALARDHSTATARANATARSCKPPARVVSICLDESAGATERAIQRAQAAAAWRAIQRATG